MGVPIISIPILPHPHNISAPSLGMRDPKHDPKAETQFMCYALEPYLGISPYTLSPGKCLSDFAAANKLSQVTDLVTL